MRVMNNICSIFLFIMIFLQQKNIFCEIPSKFNRILNSQVNSSNLDGIWLVFDTNCTGCIFEEFNINSDTNSSELMIDWTFPQVSSCGILSGTNSLITIKIQTADTIVQSPNADNNDSVLQNITIPQQNGWIAKYYLSNDSITIFGQECFSVWSRNIKNNISDTIDSGLEPKL